MPCCRPPSRHVSCCAWCPVCRAPSRHVSGCAWCHVSAPHLATSQAVHDAVFQPPISTRFRLHMMPCFSPPSRHVSGCAWRHVAGYPWRYQRAGALLRRLGPYRTDLLSRQHHARPILQDHRGLPGEWTYLTARHPSYMPDGCNTRHPLLIIIMDASLPSPSDPACMAPTSHTVCSTVDHTSACQLPRPVPAPTSSSITTCS